MNIPPVLNPRPWPAIVASILLGSVAGIICWATMRQDRLGYTPWVVTASVAALLIGYLFPVGAWRWGLLVTGSIGIGTFAAMIPGWVKDPTSNNLWPLVLAVLMGLCLLPSLVCVYIGAGLRRLVQRMIS